MIYPFAKKKEFLKMCLNLNALLKPSHITKIESPHGIMGKNPSTQLPQTQKLRSY